MTFYRKRHIELLPYFTQETDIVYFNSVASLLRQLLSVVKYDPQDWRFFTDNSKRSSKCVHLHNRNLYGSVPIGYRTTMKEKCNKIKFIVEKILFNNTDGSYMLI